MSANFHITRIALSQLRKFDALELRDLTSGLNIIAGPNGAGKSSLAQAIRAAFLDRYGSSAATDLQPMNNSGAAPTVALDFVLQGKPHLLRKTFLKKKRCDLVTGSHTLTEQEAEDYLAEQLGFGFGKRGRSAEHWGVPGLLWVNQGGAMDQLSESVRHASTHLGTALHAQQTDAGAAQGAAANLAASAGDALIAQLEQSLARHVSKVTRKPTADYAALLEQLQSRRVQLQAQQQRVAEYRAQVDELEQWVAAEQKELQEQPARQWQAQLAQAQQRQAQLQQLQQRQQQAQAQAQQLQMAIDALQRELQQQGLQQRKLQERQQALGQAQQAHAAAAATLQQAQAYRSTAQQQADAANRAWLAAQQARECTALQARAQDASRQLQRLQTAEAKALQELQKLQQLSQALPSQRLEKADIAALQKLEEVAFKAATQRDAMATRLQFELPVGQQLPWQAGGQVGQFSGSGEQWLDGALQIDLPGGGMLRIAPGGQGVAGVGQRHADAQQALQQTLRQLGVASRAQAEQLWEQQQALAAERHTAQQLLAAQAPQGLEALRLEIAQQAAQLQACQAQLQAMPDVDVPVDWAHAQAAWQASADALQGAQTQEQAARQQLALAEQQCRSAQVELDAATHSLNDPAVQARVQEAQKQLVLREAELAQLHQQMAQSAQALQSPEVRFAAQDMERLASSLQAHAEQQQARNVRMAQLRSALEVAGAQGLEEANAVLAGEIAHDERRLDAIERHTQALAMVVDRLKAKRSAALRRLQAPLEARMQHYLQLLLPGARVELNEQLLPHTVLASEAAMSAAALRVAGPVQSLSYGTQEQLAIISRLAYADLLRDAGQPTLLMLDDVLTFSDQQRLAQMKRVVYDAASRHQILLLTCHPENWADMGVAARLLPA